MAIEILFVPAVEGLAAEMSGDIMRPANHLALFHGDINLATTGVAKHNVELRADGIL